MRGILVVAVCLCVLSVPGHARPTRQPCRQRSVERASERAIFSDKIFVGDIEDLPEGEDDGGEEDELCEEDGDSSESKEFEEWGEGGWSESWEDMPDENWDGDIGEEFPEWGEESSEETSESNETDSSESNQTSEVNSESDETSDESRESSEMSDESDETSEVVSESDETSEDVSESDETSEDVSESDETSEDVSESDETSEDVSESDETSEDVSESDETSEDVSESDETSEDVSESDETSEDVSVSDETSEEGRPSSETDEESSESTEATGDVTASPGEENTAEETSPETPVDGDETEQDEEERSPMTRKAGRFDSISDNRFIIANLTDGMRYLRDFGWFEPDERFDMISDTKVLSPVMRRAITNFQKFAGIQETGELDEKTTEMMRRPRCGFADTGSKLASYTTLGSHWRKNDLTYRILNFTPDLPRADVERELKRALETWSEYTPLRFERLTGNTRSDIEISFASFGHGDGNSFDGPGSTLAHAYGPGNGIGGDSHFDESETWTINRGSSRPRGIDLHQVAAHEFGHALGLGHSQENLALMAPFYRYQSDFRLHRDDINGIQRLYGTPPRPTNRPPPPPEPTNRPPPPPEPTNRPPPPPPTLRPPPPPGGDRDAMTCSGAKFDAFARLANGSVYAFRGRYFWRLNSAGADPGYPLLITDVWEGLPADGIDAALYWPPNGRTYFFKGGQYWRFDGASPDSGYPRSIRLWRTVPNIDAALYYGEYRNTNRAYFYKGDQYWRYTQGNRRQDRGYPKALSAWRGFPDRLDAAIQWTNDVNYIFKGDQYWRLDDFTAVTDAANPPYPRSVAKYWMGC
ncbi:stromelysin-2-like [Branchiostoma lanceolatum]|uniref:stromelysin-2-like n=1 Tax=Branchiostoma lanceolatum TaxID=7740 RepID=UPI0034522163